MKRHAGTAETLLTVACAIDCGGEAASQPASL